MPDNTEFANRMKLYEQRYSNDRFMPLLPVVSRMDGRGFSKFCKGLRRPFDPRMSRIMIETTKALLMETNAKVGYTQSDEITLVWYSGEFEKQIWFDAKVQKMVSHLASLTTGIFNFFLSDIIPEKVPRAAQHHTAECKLFENDSMPTCTCGRWESMQKARIPEFDSRVFDVPNLEEACNEILWREVDATKNSVSMAANHYFSHKQLHGMGRADQIIMLQEKGVNWHDYPSFFKRGTYLQRKSVTRDMNCAEISRTPASEQEKWDGCPPKVIRSKVIELNLEPLMQIPNRVQILLGD